MNQQNVALLREQNARSGFTLTELVVVLAVLAVLATLASQASHHSAEQVLRTRCASNLRQIGVGLNIYAAEADDFLPTCKYRDANTWYTYEMARTVPGTTNLTEGYENLGLLFSTKAIADPSMLYCPAQTTAWFTYEYYGTLSSVWPATPVGSSDDGIRAGFSYFPQVRRTESVGGGYVLPRITSATSTLLSPTKLTEVNPRKSIVTDLVRGLDSIPHHAYGELVGLNALFPDGSVGFQNARTHPEAFDPTLWNNIANDGLKFRIALNNWAP